MSASGSRYKTQCWLLHCLLALAVLHSWQSLHLTATALPITSRPIEGNAQRLAWDEWLRLPQEQKTLEKEKKVTAKSIFTLPYRHCPPGHKLYNERCIPQINIDPADLLKQELLELVGGGGLGGGSSSTGGTDYDYDDEEALAEEIIGELMPTMQLGNAGKQPVEDQALPSEDAPLKFNIFEKKFPTGTGEAEPIDLTLSTELSQSNMTQQQRNQTAATTATATTVQMDTGGSVATTTTALPAMSSSSSNDLQAESTNLMSTTGAAFLNPSSSSGSTLFSFGDLGNIDAIVLPAGLTGLDLEPLPSPSVGGVVKAAVNEGADQDQSDRDDEDVQLVGSPLSSEVDAQHEADLAQLLKVDAFLPAYPSRLEVDVDVDAAVSHRRVAPLLSADIDDDVKVKGEAAVNDDDVYSTVTDIVPTEASEEEELELEQQFGDGTTKLSSDATNPTTNTISTIETTMSLSSASTTGASLVDATLTTPTTPTVYAQKSTEPQQPQQPPQQPKPQETVERENGIVLKKSKVEPVQLSSTAATTATTMESTTTTTTTGTIEEQTDAIHQASNANDELAAVDNNDDDDRFYYQHFGVTQPKDVNTKSSPRSSSSEAVDDDVQVDDADSGNDNLMINTIAGQAEGVAERQRQHAAGAKDVKKIITSEINFEKELRIINELVKGKRRLSQQQQQPQKWMHSTDKDKDKDTDTDATTATTATTTTAKDVSTSMTNKVDNAGGTTLWSKILPKWSSTATESSTTADTTITADTTTTADTTATSTTQLSINTNRSNRNSKIIRVNNLVDTTKPTTTTTTAATTTTTITTTTTADTTAVANNSAENYAPFWWLPIGWRVDRNIDKENGQDRSLLLRFLSNFREPAATTTTTTTAAAAAANSELTATTTTTA